MKHIVNIENGKPVDYVRLDDVNKIIDKWGKEYGHGIALEELKEKLKEKKNDI